MTADGHPDISCPAQEGRNTARRILWQDYLANGLQVYEFRKGEG